jgi:dTDP-4-amino-4,6-dideoxygalactose transaminase
MKPESVQSKITSYILECYDQPMLQHKHLSGAGETFLFEEKIRQYYKRKFALTFSSATTAMQTVCIAMELHDTEILTSPINWGGSIAPFLLHKNKLRFTSFDTASLNMDVRDLPSAITHQTKAVLSVDYNGTPVDSKAIKKFCSEHGLKYISDSAQSFGAYRNETPAGYFADATILSFSPGKSLFGFEGGAVITDDEKLYEKMIWYSRHPSKQKTFFGISNYNEYAPLNGRMNPLSAIILNETFESSIDALKIYQEKCFQLLTQLQTENLVEATPHIPTPEASSFFSFSIQLKTPNSLQPVNDFLKEHNQPFTTVPSTEKVIPLDSSFRKQFRGRFSCSENLQKQKSESHFSKRIKFIHSSENNNK